jgi:hypothetical protein
LDKVVKVWDLRQTSAPLRQVGLDDTAILKVALGGSGGVAAVSTLSQLYLFDVAGDGLAPVEGGFGEARSGRYHDMKWSKRGELYAAGDDQRVDVYTLQPRAAKK